jgi:hypothetical protein
MSNPKLAAFMDLKRLAGALRGIMALADDLAAIGSIEQAAQEAQARLDQIKMETDEVLGAVEKKTALDRQALETDRTGMRAALVKELADQRAALVRDAKHFKEASEAAEMAAKARHAQLLAEPERLARQAEADAAAVVKHAQAQAEEIVNAARSDPAHDELLATQTALAQAKMALGKLTGTSGEIAAARAELAAVNAEHERVAGLIEELVSKLSAKTKRKG